MPFSFVRLSSLARAFTMRGLCAAMVLLALVAVVRGVRGVTPLQAQQGVDVHIVVGTADVTGEPKGKKDVSLSLDVQGAPVERSECTVQGTGTPGPWSGPTYSWDAAVSSDPSAVAATLENNSQSTNTLHLQFFKAGDTTVTVSGGVSYSSSCGNASDGDTRTINVHVNGKVWDVGTPIEPGTAKATGGDTAEGAPATIDWNQTTQVSVEGAKDSDHWKDGATEGTEDDEVTYHWSGQGSFATPDAAASQWTPPASSNEASAIYKLHCTIDDKPKALGEGEGGTRDDAPEELTVEVTVTRKKWDKGSPIQLGGSITSDVTPQLSLQGEMKLYVAQGQEVHLSIPTATDTDHWVYRDTAGDEADEVNYTWSGGVGLSKADGQSVTWTAPLLTGQREDIHPFTLTCTVDDKPKPVDTANGETGTRNDAENNTSKITLVVVRRMWVPSQGIGFHPRPDAQGGFDPPHPTWLPDGEVTSPVVDSLTNIASVLPGEHVACALSPAHDWDRWQNGDIAGTANFAWVEDSPLTYSWSATRGSFLVGEGENAQLQDHADTREAVWVAPADGSGGLAVLTCVVDDAAGDRIGDPLTEVGSRNDDALVRTVTVEVVPSYWSAQDKEIGYHPKRDENNNIIEPHQWLPDGRMTAPLDQTVETPATEKSVAPGESVPCSVEAAQDWDTLTTKDGKSIEQDDTLTYTWSSGGKGHFLVPDPDGGPPTQAATATGTSATWIAPDDITEDTEVELKCTIDDATGARVTVPVGGSHDDGKVERTAKIKVLVPKVTFTQMDGKALPSTGARSCAGGVALDGVHDFTILATAKLSDGTPVSEHTPFKLSFENNKGHDYSGDDASIWPDDWIAAKQKAEDKDHPVPMNIDELIKKAKFVTTDEHGNPKLVETLPVETDAKGQFAVHMLSSDIVSTNIKIKVKRAISQGQDVDAGEQACDFGEAVSLRRGPNEFDPNEVKDTGWKFNFPILSKPNATTPAKIWMKFQIREPDQDGNWAYTNHHRLFIRVSKVVLKDGTEITGDAEELKDYAFISSASDPDSVTQTVETGFTKDGNGKYDGSVQVTLKAGQAINSITLIELSAESRTQWEE